MTKPSQPIGGEPVQGTATRDRTTERDLAALLRLHTDANVALLGGDALAYFEMLRPTDDFTLMTPFGGAPSLGLDASPEGVGRLGRFFRAGTLEVERVAAYAAVDMAVLALIERADVEVGDLPRQPWGLRVTVAFRREASGWRLVHRHADPLLGGIGVAEAAALAHRATGQKGQHKAAQHGVSSPDDPTGQKAINSRRAMRL